MVFHHNFHNTQRNLLQNRAKCTCIPLSTCVPGRRHIRQAHPSRHNSSSFPRLWGKSLPSRSRFSAFSEDTFARGYTTFDIFSNFFWSYPHARGTSKGPKVIHKSQSPTLKYTGVPTLLPSPVLLLRQFSPIQMSSSQRLGNKVSSASALRSFSLVLKGSENSISFTLIHSLTALLLRPAEGTL